MPRSKRRKLTDQQVLALYRKGVPIRVIAKRARMCTVMLYRILDRCGEPRRFSGGGPPLPPPEEIEARKREVQEQWTDEERAARAGECLEDSLLLVDVDRYRNGKPMTRGGVVL